MPVILIPVKLKGEGGEVEENMLANSGSDIVVLPEKTAKKVGVKISGEREIIEVGGGILVKGQPCSVTIGVKDLESGKERSQTVKAYVVAGQEIPLLGISGLDKLGIILDTSEGKYKLK